MKSMMRAAIWHGEPQLKVQLWEKPEVGPGQVLVRVAYAGICSSDIHILNNGLPREAVHPPRVIGHECSGVVEAVGSLVRSVKVGDRVTGNPVGPCGVCYYCRNKMEHFCENPFSIIRGPGEGVYAEYLVFQEKQVYKLPGHVSLKHGALVEPLSVAIHAVEQAEIALGSTCVIIGAGVIGLLISAIARKRGCAKIIMSDPNEARRRLALEMGADYVVDPAKQNLQECVLAWTENLGADVCVEVVGSPLLIEQSPSLVRHGGTVLLVGWPPREAEVKIHPFLIYRYEVQIKGAQLSPYCFHKAVNMLDQIDAERFISHVYSLEQINEAFELQRSGRGLRILIEIAGEKG